MPSAGLLVSLLLAVGLLVGVGAGPGGAYGAGGPIRVLEMGEEVNFPDGVGLTLTAEAETEIVEVRVFFRAAGSRSWGYSYAHLLQGGQTQSEPGADPRVFAMASIPGNQSGYLAPGVEVEYYYQIRDAAGNVFKTERASVEYLDRRFEWRRVNIGPLELVYHDIRDGRVADAARDISRDLERVAELLYGHLDGAGTAGGFKGVIYNSYADANAAFPVQSQTTTDRGTFAGYAFPEQGVFVGQGLDRRIIVHESAHLMLRDALGDKALNVPAWLNEGFATYTEPNARIRGSGSLYGRTPPLRAMNSVSGTPETIPLFYAKSVSVVAYLIEGYGQDNFRRLLGQLKAGRTAEDALVGVYGFGVDGLDDRWAGRPVEPAATPPGSAAVSATVSAPRGGRESGADVADVATPEPARGVAPSESLDGGPPLIVATAAPAPSQPALPPQRQERDAPSPFVFFDAWVLAGVALLAFGAVGFRWVYSRLRRRGRGDDWADWDGC